jgi:hypothetical protein
MGFRTLLCVLTLTVVLGRKGNFGSRQIKTKIYGARRHVVITVQGKGFRVILDPRNFDNLQTLRVELKCAVPVTGLGFWVTGRMVFYTPFGFPNCSLGLSFYDPT